MARKIFSWILLVLGGIFFLASLAGIVAIWVYNTPLTNEATRRLQDVDLQLAQAQTTLDSSEKELARALRIVDSAQAALDKLKAQTNSTGNFLETVQSTLDDRLLPELKNTRDRINSASATLQQLQSVLNGIGGFIPGLDLSAPDKVLADLISSANSMNAEITNIEGLTKQASTFVKDSSFLLGGDLTETRTSLQTFVTSIQEYETKVTGWRKEVARLTDGAPRWIDQASIALTIFLVWFALSQLGLMLHGLAIQRGAHPFAVFRQRQVEVKRDGVPTRAELIETVETENDSLT